MSIVIIVSLQRKLLHKKKQKEKLKLSILVPSSGCHTQSSPSESLDKWGMEGPEPRCGQYTVWGTPTVLVRDLLIDLQLRSCKDKFNIPSCYGEHRTN